MTACMHMPANVRSQLHLLHTCYAVGVILLCTDPQLHQSSRLAVPPRTRLCCRPPVAAAAGAATSPLKCRRRTRFSLSLALPRQRALQLLQQAPSLLLQPRIRERGRLGRRRPHCR